MGIANSAAAPRLLFNTLPATMERAGKVFKDAARHLPGIGVIPDAIGDAVTYLGKQDYNHTRIYNLLEGHNLYTAAAPVGAMMILLYPFTIGSRVIQAYERGKEHNDFREIGDVLRRDVTAISIFLFGVERATNTTLGNFKIGPWKVPGMQQLRGVRLFNAAGSSLSYEALKEAYTFDNHKNLLNTLKDQLNTRHFLTVIDDELNTRATTEKGTEALSQLKQRFRAGVKGILDSEALKGYHAFVKSRSPEHLHTPALWDEWKALNPENAQAAERLEAMAKDAFQHLELMSEPVDAMAREFHNPALPAFFQKVLGGGLGIPDKFFQKSPKAFFANYAMKSRVPGDVVANAIVAGLLGYGVVAFNDWYNNMQYKHKQAQLAAMPATQKSPAVLPAAAPQLSNLPAVPARPLPAFNVAPNPGSSVFTTRPTATLPLAANGFNPAMMPSAFNAAALPTSSTAATAANMPFMLRLPQSYTVG